MLQELCIRDLALIERAALQFGPGLNAITGETGAGKSLLVGALEMILGLRPRPGLVRSGADSAVVEGRFIVPRPAPGRSGEPVYAWLRANLPDVAQEWEELGADEDRELILSRSVSRDGAREGARATKSRAHVNHHPITLKLMRELGSLLVEIHGQNDTQRLLESGEQLRLLDAFGNLEPLVDAYVQARVKWRELARRASEFETDASLRRDRMDLLRFQLGELRAAAPEAGERSRLCEERDVLRYAKDLKSEIGAITFFLSEGDDAALDMLRRAESVVEKWRQQVATLTEPAEDLRSSVLHLEDATRWLRAFVDAVEIDPARLESLEERLAVLEHLERKYGTDCAGLVELVREFQSELEGLEAGEQDRDALDREIGLAHATLERRAKELTEARRESAPRLERAATKMLSELGMMRASLQISLEPHTGGEEAEADQEGRPSTLDERRFGEAGAERSVYLIAANPGEPLQPMKHVASGGEAARVMLALRCALASAGAGRTLVFDEIDAGVGGRLGPEVGRRMRELASQHQVLCVTHLPAIAAQAHSHLLVSKATGRGRARTDVVELEGDARIEEVADMIAGGGSFETARAEAKRLIDPD